MKARTPIAVALLCAACASSTGVPEGEVDAAGSAERAFKGYELYSWRTDQGEWRYALVAGTNRLKAWSELEAEAVSETGLRRRRGLPPPQPFEQIPAIDDDGLVLSESAAILVYLAKKSGRLTTA